MQFYGPSPLSLGYIPRRSYRPTPVSTYLLDDEFSSAPTFEEGLGYPGFSHTYSPRVDAETRYRRAVHELQAAEEEFEAHLSLKRARQAAVLREQAVHRERALAIQAAHRERALAVQAEAERIEHMRAFHARPAEEYEWHQRARHAEVALDRARRQKHALLHGFVDTDRGDSFASEHPLAGQRLTHPGPSRRPVPNDGEVPTLEGLLKLFSGIHHRPQPRSPVEQSGSRAPSQRPSAEPQPSEKQDVEGDALKAFLEFIHGLSAHAGEVVTGSETIPAPRPVPQPQPQPQPQAAPVPEKGKGKAKTEPAAGLTLLQTLLGAHTRGPSDQESKDLELAIKLSLEDRNAAHAKKGSPGASSSRVKLDGILPPTHTPSPVSDTTTATSRPIPAPVQQPVSHLTTIRAVRNHFSALESTFKFPGVLDFDGSALAVSPKNAPIRAYETALNGLLEQLDAIESDGDEEVRNVRREVVREVEKALEDLEQRVGEKASKPQVTKNVEVKGYDVEAEQLGPLAAQEAVPAEVTVVAEAAEPTGSEPSAPTDADLAIKQVVAELGDNAVAQTAEENIPSLDVDALAPSLEDFSDSLATISVTPASGPSPDVYVTATPAPESFLASMSHDQFTFPPKPAYSDSGASAASAQDDVVLVDTSEEGESVKSGEDGWSEVDA